MRQWLSGVLIVVVAASLLIWPDTALAGATLYYNPSSLSAAPGGKISTTIYVNTDQAVNSIDVTATFPAGILGDVTVDVSGSVFPVTLFQPQVNNSAGTIRFVQTAVVPYSGSSGKVGTVTYTAKSAGTGNLGFSSGSKVIANNGQGTNIYTGGSGAAVSIASVAQPQSTPVPTQAPSSSKPQASTPSTTTTTKATTSAPAVAAATHPDQSAWYVSKQIKASWNATGQEYAVAVDQNAVTVPPESPTRTTTSLEQEVSGEGVWYVHVRAKSGNGWSQTTHYKAQIDQTPPEVLGIQVKPEGELTVLPEISFNTTDALSGVNAYQIKIDSGEWKTQTSPYKVDKISSGKHTVSIKAIDRAGNERVGTTDFTIKQLSTPVITSPESNSLLRLGEKVTIQGKADPNVQVELKLINQLLNTTKTESITTDENGNFVSSEQLLLLAGAYKVIAQAINADGISSPASNELWFKIDPQVVQVLGIRMPGWLAFSILGMVIVLLLMVSGWLGLQLWRLTHAWARKVVAMRGRLGGDVTALEAELTKTIDETLAAQPEAAAALKHELGEEMEKLHKEVEAVGDDLMQHESVLPSLAILHGAERFTWRLPGKQEQEARGQEQGDGEKRKAESVKSEDAQSPKLIETPKPSPGPKPEVKNEQSKREVESEKPEERVKAELKPELKPETKSVTGPAPAVAPSAKSPLPPPLPLPGQAAPVALAPAQPAVAVVESKPESKPAVEPKPLAKEKSEPVAPVLPVAEAKPMEVPPVPAVTEPAKPTAPAVLPDLLATNVKAADKPLDLHQALPDK